MYLYIMGGNPLQKLNVFLAVESGHVRTGGNVRPEHLKPRVWTLIKPVPVQFHRTCIFL